MKVVAVIGSPHPHGPSATLTEELLRGAQDAGHEVVTYRLNDLQVRGCQACRVCKEQDVDCILQDDLAPYWKDLHECGALIVSAPNYCARVSGPMMTYMNRHYCIIRGDGKIRVHPGIKLVGIFSQGRPDPDVYKAAYDEYLADFQARDMVLTGEIIHTGNQPLDADSPEMKQAYDLGHSL